MCFFFLSVSRKPTARPPSLVHRHVDVANVAFFQPPPTDRFTWSAHHPIETRFRSVWHLVCVCVLLTGRDVIMSLKTRNIIYNTITLSVWRTRKYSLPGPFINVIRSGVGGRNPKNYCGLLAL